jgi:hypothetical protein
VNGSGWERPSSSRARMPLRRSPRTCGSRSGRYGCGGRRLRRDQRWTLGRIKTLIGKLFHIEYTVEGTWKLMRRHGWSCQVPVRQAMERDDAAVAVWKAEVWPDIKKPRATWAPRGAPPLVRVPHLFYLLRVYRRRKGEARGFTWQDYWDLIIAAHRNLSAPLIWVWDNLNIHLPPELAESVRHSACSVGQAAVSTPVIGEGIWSLLKRSIANFAAAGVDGLIRIVKRKLKKIQYRPRLINGCLAAAGLTTGPW